MDTANRLKSLRTNAGFRSATEAAQNFGWVTSTYAAHENGSRGMKRDDAIKYAAAFRSDPGWLYFGTEVNTSPSEGISEAALRLVIPFVLKNEGALNAPPEVIADLVIDLCQFVSTSGEAGLDRVVDFALARRAAQGR